MEVFNPTEQIFLIRHASPDWSRRDLPYYLPPGPPLTDHGRSEAEALGRFLRRAQVQQLFVSPLERCQATAEIAGQVAQAKLEILAEAIEWSPEETRQDVRRRCQAVLERMRATARQAPVGLISHGGPIGILLTELGMDPLELERLCTYDHRNPLPPAGAWEARRPGAQAPWQLHLAFTPRWEPDEVKTEPGDQE